jgi:hypothetical protein
MGGFNNFWLLSLFLFFFVVVPVYKLEINYRGNPLRWPRDTLYPQVFGTNFANTRRSLGRYSSLVDQSHGVLLLSFLFYFCVE